MSYKTTVAEGLRRAAHLIPFHAAGSSNLRGEYGAVCTPAATVPARFREAQAERTHYYRTARAGLARRAYPGHAPRYWVTSYGVPIAWVTLDGRTHFTKIPNDPAWRTMRKHRDAIRASWPARFAMDSQGDPIRPDRRVPGPLRSFETTNV